MRGAVYQIWPTGKNPYLFVLFPEAKKEEKEGSYLWLVAHRVRFLTSERSLVRNLDLDEVERNPSPVRVEKVRTNAMRTTNSNGHGQGQVERFLTTLTGLQMLPYSKASWAEALVGSARWQARPAFSFPHPKTSDVELERPLAAGQGDPFHDELVLRDDLFAGVAGTSPFPGPPPDPRDAVQGQRPSASLLTTRRRRASQFMAAAFPGGAHVPTTKPQSPGS